MNFPSFPNQLQFFFTLLMLLTFNSKVVLCLVICFHETDPLVYIECRRFTINLNCWKGRAVGCFQCFGRKLPLFKTPRLY